MKDKETRLCTGLTLTTYGVFLLLNSMEFMAQIPLKLRIEMLDWRTLLLYGAAFFLLFKRDKTFGLILLVLGLLFRFHTIYAWIMIYIYLVWPLFFIISGVTLLYLALRRS